MAEVKLVIDGKKITTQSDQAILQAALDNHIYIPHLCYHADLEPVGVCRLCIVEVKGRGLATSCNTKVEPGLIVETATAEVNQLRRVNAELLIANHHQECLDNFEQTGCKLKQIADFLGIKQEDTKRLKAPEVKRPIDTSNPFFDRDPNKCVLCGICVRTCENLTCVSAIDFIHRGYDSKIGTFADAPIDQSRCESCGECVMRCPTGALSAKKFKQPERFVKTTCTYCGVGCGLYLGIKDNRVVTAAGDHNNPVNRGSLCVKGRFGYDFINHPERLKSPLLKRNGKFVAIGWNQALKIAAAEFLKYQGQRFAALSSAKCTNEENYIIQKFVRAVMGTNNIDHCARLCHAPTVAGLGMSFGSGAMTNSINELKDAAGILAIGTNTTAAHPVIGLKIKRAQRQQGVKLIVANPKEIELARYADIFLQHKPGTDVALLMGMMQVIVAAGLQDREFIRKRCENFDAFKKSLSSFKISVVEKITGVPGDKIKQAARVYATSKPAAIVYAMGITQHTHGTDNVLATSNLALLTGNIGKPSSGVNPLRGQNNVQGACDLGALPNVYPGYQKVENTESRKKFESAWGLTLPEHNGLTHVEIFDAVLSRTIKAMYIVGENPVLSEADASHVKAALRKLKFLVVQDIFLSETAKYADLILPAVSFAEKDGTFTNTERRVQRIRRAIEPTGRAQPDWEITCKLARKMGANGFDFSDPEQIMREIAALTPSYAGISYPRIEQTGLQWVRPLCSGSVRPQA
ncbi:formate dehydrogenase subunit alpha, partial [Candidatus Omnitrophota bacterium]